ncbi:MAG: hypothetical protein WBE90_06255 [Xanthobacteraceae bacterium]
MASAQDFWDYADKCLEWVASAESDQEQKTLRRMALAWWRMARLTDEGRPLEDLADVFPAYPKSALTDIDYLSANTQPKFKSAQNGR